MINFESNNQNETENLSLLNPLHSFPKASEDFTFHHLQGSLCINLELIVPSLGGLQKEPGGKRMQRSQGQEGGMGEKEVCLP